MKRYAVVCARGIGDGLLSLVLSHNLQRNGNQVTTFSSPLTQLRPWFPSHTLLPFPQKEESHNIFQEFDEVFALSDTLFQQIPPLKNLTLLAENAFNRKKNLIDNLLDFCSYRFPSLALTKENGIVIPPHVKRHQFKDRIVLHPMSSDVKKNWLPEKFLNLAEALHSEGWSPVLMMSPEEKKGWETLLAQYPQPFPCPLFSSLSEAATFLAESAYLIGNDSGVGHLASNLQLPTLTLFSKQSSSHFWRPAWGINRTIVPPFFLISGRLREKKWKEALTVNRVLRHFKKLYEQTSYVN